MNAFSAAFLLLSRAAVAAGLTVLAAQTAQAQVPKTIRIVVPFPAGGPTDTTARVIAEQIGKLTGTAFVVENRPGGGSAITSEAVARAAPDGGTLLIVAGALLINPILKKVNYDPLTSFEPICWFACRTSSSSTRIRHSRAFPISSRRPKPGPAS